MWIHDHKGVFTVKYAYKLNHDNSNGSNASFEWQRIWKLKAHERTKMLIWRIGANVLPTKERIAQRMSISDTSYSLCNAEPKSGAHLFFNCKVARAIWYGGSWCFKSDSISVQSNEDIVKLVLDPPCLGRLQNKAELKDHYSLIRGTTIEAIWNLRNRVLHNGEHINLDAAKRSSHSDPLQAETYAILWALKLAAEESFLRILVEGDAKICLDAIHGESSAP
uniref:Reverse transcriptase zinc-binding domain-containing protein n=1 Tax=Fagus sylvatica TaxID=28930 RepID=A0A2N9IUZ3_FAGSY